ncbi:MULTISPECIES: alpha/beta fold hydrolase [unclassified Cupriavidus]|uniref:alpha/beta fold hydrolase n=1 Tax=unclassified Cupriavidus TaxID=2640874 RepID=UPI001C008A27|nr:MULTISPECIES: alpha/beta fold hydrolase [unclassified Cupriavidus]MCA3191405.1 alpha/beta fold hydrolase [Cupriavidus sp.]MCA3196565.1 alpha/beta fold hydrolase [Cupriavidus sp.]MCA3203145.1 alpha/beta fold hydrolase [Cupriavidus sp.]MCA3209880.1 alpha/beta fold hydrolase [Cupriavidus sp.]QWE95163.1 alpha/beta fold hydrolase [Cupriavidus sp. EM10]
MSLTAAALRRLAVVVQATAACGLAAWLALTHGWAWLPASAAGLAAVLVVFGISVAMAFGATLGGLGIPLHNRLPLPDSAPPRHRLGASAAIRCFLAECRAVFRMFNWLQPFRSRLHLKQPPHPLPDTPHVLLVHGYGCNHAIWLDMAPALAAAGYRCEAIDLTPVLGDIDDYAPQLLARMREMASRTGRAPLLVCHSMGGLAARAAQVLAEQTGGEPACAGIVTLGSPHQGCALARFGSGRNARQMRWRSAWLTALAAAETPSMRARIVSVFSWHDSIAGPPGTSWLDGARHLALEGIGHVSLLRDPRAIQATLAALAMLQRQPAARAMGAAH